MKMKDLASMETEALLKELDSQRSTLLEKRFQKSMGALENTAELQSLKRTIARIRTVLTQRQRETSAAG